MQALWPLMGFLGLLLLAGGGWARLRRRPSVPLLPGERPLLEARAPARLFVDRPLPGGLRPGRINPVHVHLLLTERRLAAATWAGLLFSAGPGEELRVACTGPRRLVVEALRRSRRGAVRLRLELLVERAEEWEREARGALGEGAGPLAGLGVEP